MAKLANYEVPPAPQPGAREEWEELLEVLHRSGTLRFMRGFFGKFGAVNDAAFTELNSEPGQNITGALLAIGQLLAQVNANDIERAVSGAAKGIHAAKYLRKPPSTWRIIRLLHSADTRRAVGTLLLVLNGIGEGLRKPVPNEPRG